MTSEYDNAEEEDTESFSSQRDDGSLDRPEEKASGGTNDPKEKKEMTEDIVSLFILKSMPTSTSQAETYLRNRGWIVGTGVNLREALAYIIQKQPQFVLLSVDHPNKKVRVLPKLLVQAFPVRVFAFAEKSSTMTVKNFTDMGLEYNLYPPVSGPAIERMVLKIKKDIELRANSAEKEKASISADNGTPDYITFKGESNVDSGALKSGFEQARAALSQIVNSTDSDADDSGLAGTIPGQQSGLGGAIIQKGIGHQAGAAYMGQPGSNQEGGFQPGSGIAEGPGSAASGQEQGSQSSGNFAFFPNEQSGETMQAKGTTPQGSSIGGQGPTEGSSGPGENESFAEWAERMRRSAKSSKGTDSSDQESSGDAKTSNESSSSPERGSDRGSQGGKESDTAPVGEQQGDNPWGDFKGQALNKHSQLKGRESGGYQKGDLKAPIMESDQPASKKPKPRYKDAGKERLSEKDSIFVRGTQKALDESSRADSDIGEAQAIDRSSNVACITVESERFSGYLVCALGKDRKIDDSFIETVKGKLFEFLRANGEVVKSDNSMQLKIEQVEFEDWAIHQADFLRKSIHGKDEVAMAFFPTKDIKARLEESASEQMVKLSLTDLKPDTALEFDLYMYMPENNKYLLYTPQGMVFYGRQKDRLSEKGVTHMHLRKESANNVRRYKAQNFLNEKIQQYKKSRGTLA